MQGWIKLHRKLMQTSFYRDSETVHLAIHLLLKANHCDKDIIFNNEEITIKRGSLITGRQALSRETGIHESTVYRKLKVLEKVGFSNTTSNNKFSIITILNYSTYNSNDNATEQQAEQPVNNQRTQTRMYKNDNKLYSRFFEERWKRYPNKDGRKEALKHFLATVKTDEDLKNFDRALENYLGHLKIENWKQPKNGKTFFNNWGDWVDWTEPSSERDDRVVL